MINFEAIKAIYKFEMARTFRTIIQSIISPVLSTILYFIVFGTAIGKNINFMSDIPYGAFIVPGLILLTVSMQSVTNASFGIFFPKFLGTTYEFLSAPISYVEIVIGFVGAATTKSFFLGVIIFITSTFFVEIRLEYPFLMLLMLLLSCILFSLLGFIIGICSDNFEQINFVPMIIITPLVFLGGSFYTIDVLPEIWQTVTLFNPIFYLISGFRYSFFGSGEIHVMLSISSILIFILICNLIIWKIFKHGYKIKQ